MSICWNPNILTSASGWTFVLTKLDIRLQNLIKILGWEVRYTRYYSIELSISVLIDELYKKNKNGWDF